MIASAALVNQAQLRTASRREDWQNDAWRMYDNVSELRFGVSWLANALSRSRLYIANTEEVGEDSTAQPDPVDDERVAAPLDELFGGRAGQSQMLSRMGVHLSIPGETYLIGMDIDRERRWLTASNDEFTAGRNRTQVRLPETDQLTTIDPDSSVIIRLWRPHPRRANHPDSPTRGLLPVLRELQGLTSHISANIDSRLAGAGMLVLPESASLPRPQQSEGANPVHEDPWVSSLIEAMITPLQNRDSAAAVVPIVTRVPDEAAGKVQHISFATELSEKASEMRDKAIRRVGLGMDIPPEILLGMGEVNHWTSWQVSEEAIKLHVRPLLALICDALTEQYYRPALRAMQIPNPDSYTVWPDTSELEQRPNRGPESLQLYDRGLLAPDSTLQEHGFSEEDMPDADQRREHLALQLIQSVPALAPYLLPILNLGDNVPNQPAPEGSGEGNSGDGGTGAGRPELPATDPQRPRTASGNIEGWRIACLEMAVYRALERAGQWLLNSRSRSYRGQLREVPLHEIHTHIPAPPDKIPQILNGAYRELANATPDTPCLHDTVDQYVRALLEAGHPHHTNYLAVALARSGCDTDAA